MNTYAKEFKDQIFIVAYGVEGLTDHVDSEVYDAHEAFEIDKTKMKMLVPLDMNNQKIMNTNFDLKFRDLFKIIRCIIFNHPSNQNLNKVVYKYFNNGISAPLSFSVPVVIHSIILPKQMIRDYNKGFIEISEKLTNDITRININDNLSMLRIFHDGINHFYFYNIGNDRWIFNIVIAYM